MTVESTMAGQTSRIIAFAVDESEYAEHAFNWYIDHMHRKDDFIVFIHVPEYYDYALSAAPSVIEQLMKELETRVGKLERKFTEKLLENQISGKFCSGSGKPGEVVIMKATEENATMIMTGSRGLGSLRRTILGSVSDYIVHHSNVPVLVCRHKTQ